MKAAQTLLERTPDLEGKIITADALHCQKATAAAIMAKGGEYILQIKANQAGLLAQARAATGQSPPFFRNEQRARTS